MAVAESTAVFEIADGELVDASASWPISGRCIFAALLRSPPEGEHLLFVERFGISICCASHVLARWNTSNPIESAYMYQDKVVISCGKEIMLLEVSSTGNNCYSFSSQDKVEMSHEISSLYLGRIGEDATCCLVGTYGPSLMIYLVLNELRFVYQMCLEDGRFFSKIIKCIGL